MHNAGQMRRRAGPGRRRVLYTPLPLIGFRQVIPAFLPDPMSLDWQMRLIETLKTMPVDFACRPHPEGILKGRLHPLASVIDIQTKRFEDHIADTNVFVFDYVQSTTFYEALCTDRIVVLIDMGADIFDEDMSAALRQRCRTVRAHYDDRNRPHVDVDELHEAICSGPENGDPGFFRQLLLDEGNPTHGESKATSPVQSNAAAQY